jgi:hypothetical protein
MAKRRIGIVGYGSLGKLNQANLGHYKQDAQDDSVVLGSEYRVRLDYSIFLITGCPKSPKTLEKQNQNMYMRR